MKDAGQIHELILSDGWNAIKREIKERMDGAMLQLASVARPPNVSDDALRGHIAALRWVLDFEQRVNRHFAEEKADKEGPPAEPDAVGSPMEAEFTE